MHRFCRAPTVISFDDDELLSRARIDAWVGALDGAPVERRHQAPAERRIGHFGLFHREKGPPLWAELLGPRVVG